MGRSLNVPYNPCPLRAKWLVAGCFVLVLTVIHIVISRMGIRQPWAYDVLHFGAGAAVTPLWQGFAGRSSGAGRQPRLVVLFGVLLTSAIWEGLQPLWQGDRDVWDIIVTVAGGMMFLVWTTPAQTLEQLVFWRFVAVGILGLGFSRPLLYVAARYNERNMFPRIASFESPLEYVRWSSQGCRVRRSRATSAHGRYSLHVVVLDSTPYSGASMVSPSRSWTGYRSLSFAIYRESVIPTPQRIFLRIDDRDAPPYADRFQAVFPLTTGWNRIALDLEKDLRTEQGRFLNKESIRSLTFFLANERPGASFYLDDIRLDP